MPLFKSTSNQFRLFLTVFFVLGTLLRSWEWSSQILLDDEWHALNFVLTRSFTDVVIQQGMGANSIPVNIYSWLVLHTTGWSEPLLRLPSLIAGIAALIVIPLLIRRIWGNSVACIFAAMLAVSPVVIFYSRITRPYAPTMFLATVSILLTFSWLKNARRSDLLLSAFSGSLAIYYHLYAFIPVSVPLLSTIVAAILPKNSAFGLTTKHKEPLGHILQAAVIMIVIVGLLVVVPNVINPWWANNAIHSMDHANQQTAITLISLISGTNNTILMILTAILLLIGFVRMFLLTRIAGSAIILSYAIFALIMGNTTQDGAHAGIQVVRYGITFVPISFISIALAIVWIGETLREKFSFFKHNRYLLTVFAIMLWMPYLLTSPLWTTYKAPNNFSNHSAFQYRYEPIKWNERSPERDLTPGVSIRYESIPKFYLQSKLISSARGIIEYPVLIGDQLNMHYYYQHFHHLPVVAGFSSNNQFVDVKPGRDFVFGDWIFDSVMSAIPKDLRGKSSWRTMVDLGDNIDLQSRFKGWLLVIHLDPAGEVLGKNYQQNLMSLKLADNMLETLGNPVFSDEQIAVWMIR